MKHEFTEREITLIDQAHRLGKLVHPQALLTYRIGTQHGEKPRIDFYVKSFVPGKEDVITHFHEETKSFEKTLELHIAKMRMTYGVYNEGAASTGMVPEEEKGSAAEQEKSSSEEVPEKDQEV